MICTTIHDRSGAEVLSLLRQCEMAEIRLDSCIMSPAEMEQCFMSDVPLVATCRISELMARNPSMSVSEAAGRSEDLLVKAIGFGAGYVDVEIEAPKEMSKRVATAARENGTEVIRSFHDFEGTDSAEALKAVVEKCMRHSGAIVKIVTTAQSESDVERVLALYHLCRLPRFSGSGSGTVAGQGNVQGCIWGKKVFRLSWYRSVRLG